jgi:predicted unusual protein kinase regulating ubiquinone biosynthesis (AarF/ABC1/UbiB family)
MTLTVFAYITYDNQDFMEDLFLRLSRFNIVLVKILQCSSNNNDIWNEELKEIVKKYTDHVPFTFADMDVSTLYKLQDNGVIYKNGFNPIHSGTIALVYEGTYKDKKVIIKVKRKNILEKMEQCDNDIQKIIFISKWIPYLNKLQVEDNYHIYSPLLLTQCDFKNEIQNQNQYIHNFRNNEHVKIPKIYEDLCTEDAIVMEYIDGNNIINISNEDREPYMAILGDIMMSSIVVHGFFHCDAHAGNLMFFKKDDKHMVCALDFGICGKYNIKEIDLYYNIFTEIGKLNYKEATLLFLEGFSDYSNGDEELHDVIVGEISDLLVDAFENKKEFSFVEIFELYTILKKYNIKTNKSWLKTELGIAAIDGCMKLLKTERIALTDILKTRINELNALQSSGLFE